MKLILFKLFLMVLLIVFGFSFFIIESKSNEDKFLVGITKTIFAILFCITAYLFMFYNNY